MDKNDKAIFFVMGIVIGVCVGAVIGISFKNVGGGLFLGTSCGFVLGFLGSYF